MIINKIIGIKINGEIISEKRFGEYNIFKIEDALKDYFNRYGYLYCGIFDLENNLLIMRNMNPENQGFINKENIYDIVNYRTSETIKYDIDESIVDISTKKILYTTFSPYFQVLYRDSSYYLINISTREVVLNADEMSLISSERVVYRKHGIYYILELDTMISYPIIKKEKYMYYINEPIDFVDMRYGMFSKLGNVIATYLITNIEIDSLLEDFKYGMKKNHSFQLLDNQIYFGLDINNGTGNNEMWYDSEIERDEFANKLLTVINNLIEDEKLSRKENQKKK